MTSLKCPKNCVGHIHRYNNEVIHGISRHNPHYKCMICGWIGFETQKNCPHCEKKGEVNTLVLSKGRYYCLACNKMVLTPVDNTKLIKSLPIANPSTTKTAVKNKKKILRQCPRCGDLLFSSIHKPTEEGKKYRTLWVCRSKTCAWQGIKTEKTCKRCHHNLIFADNKLLCVYCKNCLFSINELEKARQLYGGKNNERP
ncbi:MAG: hypothetical protein U9P90_03255 [Patescibacteria group bacterium]|nr:hypothetical protein [Patescibacteria group bacterium]